MSAKPGRPGRGGLEPGAGDPPPLVLPPALVAAMLDHARAEAPLEACGIVGGRQGQPVAFYPARNADRSPVRYTVDPEDQLRIFTTMEERGEELWAIFHSHPRSPAYPSATDVRYAYYPEAYYLIASLASEPPVLRAFRILEGTITEHPLVVHGGQASPRG
ncbi:M67 family metallopeptidase [Thermaerobacter sp. PB12/4term]|uniref:Mov34/MPN/PAD-1 family protein n=1 Tax=Thermaerobacter sp. PB12/4term TaxID=2293838 RepID=UPI000E328FE6|nr:M67 family metallopeptidase [Thermaerobacter sp. PB12/4term]QIA27044.1 M67 family metallopeptidase [Thermaerobacter sp. PB12/4term]